MPLAFDSTLFLQRVVDGIQNGAIYASLALGIVLIFRATGLLNFAQGEMAMIATFITWSLHSTGLPIVLAIIVSMAIAFVCGALVERVLIRPVEHSSPLAIVIVTIGLFLALNAIAQLHWGTNGKILANPFPSGELKGGGVHVKETTIGIIIVLVLVAALLYLLFQKTKVGLAMRSVASNSESSQLVGIPVGRVLMLGWGLAGALGALAGALIAPTITAFDANFMQGVLILGFAAATLGGFDSPVGAVVGGLIVGVVESLAGGYIASDLKLATAFVLILVVLLVRPNGLFGSAEVTRV
jgi:branched-chain amino acid transport system permease protein